MSIIKQKSILVLGAGELGIPVIRHLADQIQQRDLPINLHVLLRQSRIDHISQKPAPELGDLAILKSLSLVSADIATSSLAALASLFAPHRTVISCTGFAGGAGAQLKIATAAIQARVKRFFPWQFGVDYDVIGRGSAQDLFDEQLDVRDLLRAQEQTEWVIVSTGMFTSFLFEGWFGVVEIPKAADGEVGRGPVTVRALGGWENEVTVTTPEDIGRVVARVVLDESIRNKVVYTAGDTLSFSGLANVVGEVFGSPVERETWSVRMLKENLAKDSDNTILKYRVVFAEGKGTSWNKEQTVNNKWEMPLQDVKTWATKNLK